MPAIGANWTLSVSKSTYEHRLPSLISRRKSDSVRPQHIGQLNVKSNIQEVASGGDEGCGSATSLVMTIAATIVIGQHPPNHNMSDVYCPSG